MDHKKFAIDVAKEAGEIIRKNFTLGMKKEWKGDEGPVTETDYRINTILVERVQKEFSQYGVLGEEESYNEKAANLWVCDPVDGTIAFSHGIPISTFSLALVQGGEPVLGVVYDPFMDNLYVAEKGKGAYRNGEKISVSDVSDIKQKMIEITTWYRAPYYLAGIGDKIEKDGAITTHLCSLIFATMLVAVGEYVGTIFSGSSAHDVAAAKVIVEEASGKVTDLDGNEQRYDKPIKGAIISNGKIHDYLVRVVKESLKENTKE